MSRKSSPTAPANDEFHFRSVRPLTFRVAVELASGRIGTVEDPYNRQKRA